MAAINKYLFEGMKDISDVTKYNLYRGVTDYGTLSQFNIFDSGRAFIKILGMPEYLKILASKNAHYTKLINNFVHILEYEFKGLDGIEDITAETQPISDGVNEIEVIKQVKAPSASKLQLRYMEKSGTPLIKFTELFLSGIYDPRSTAKHYHGLITGDRDVTEVVDGFEKEVFTVLYWVVDNTMWNVEKAFMIIGGQFMKSDLSIYNHEKGQHDGKEITLELNGFLSYSPQITMLAKRYTNAMNIHRNMSDVEYTYPGMEEPVKHLVGYNL